MLDLFLVVFATLGFWHYVMKPLIRWSEKIHGVTIVPKRWRGE